MFQKGVTLLEGGDPGAALQEFQKALANAIGEGKGDSLYNIAICHVRLGDIDKAMRAIAEAVTIDPSLVEEIRRDQDFAPLLTTPSFEETLAEAIRHFEVQQRAKGNLLRQQLRDLEPACRAQRKKVWTIVGIGGFFFLVFGTQAGGNGLFGGLALLAIVTTFFALQHVSLHSPFATVRKLRVELEALVWQFSAPGHLSQGSRPELTPDEQREMLRAFFKRSWLVKGYSICAIFSLGFLAAALATPWLPDVGLKEALGFAAVAAICLAIGTILFAQARNALQRLGWRPTVSQLLRASVLENWW